MSRTQVADKRTIAQGGPPKKIVFKILLPTVVLGLCASWFLLNIGSWLSPADKRPGKAELVVFLPGNNARTEKAISLVKAGLAEKIVAPTSDDYQRMIREKVSHDRIIRTDWSAESTYEDGLMVKGLLTRNIKSVMVVTDPFHLYRARWTFRHIFPDGSVRFSFISCDASTQRGLWWSNADSRFFVLTEVPKIVYYWVWHGWLHQKHDMRWVPHLKIRYNTWLTKNFG